MQRNFTVIECEQGTPEWKAARAGLATGSRAKDILAKIKSGEAASRRDYRTDLLCERLTGQPSDDVFFSKEMAWGVEQEPFARMAYEAQTGLIIRETGFLRHNTIAAGSSLDGDVDDFTGFVEIKCPKTATHIRYLESDTAPSEYMPQITHNLLISGAAYCDFISYDPRLPEHLQLVVRRVNVADVDLRGYEAELLQFLAELDAIEKRYRTQAA